MVASPYRLQSLAPAALRAAAMMAVAIGVGVWSAILLAPRPTESPPLLEVGAAVPTDLSPVVQWFGGAPLRVRVAVHGVIATDAGRGAALLSVEGAPPRAYRVGQSLAPGVVLEAVAPGAVSIAQDGVVEHVVMPRLPNSVQGFIPVSRPSP